MQKIVSFIPNLFTLGNLFCGCLALVFASDYAFDKAALMVFLAAFLDFFDGFFARLLKVEGELGKQLDSLADMVSFGLVPGFTVFMLLNEIEIKNSIQSTFVPPYAYYTISKPVNFIPYIGFIISLFSCYRLAKFNIDTRQSQGFIGLPTPANAIFFMSIAYTLCFYFTYFPLAEMTSPSENPYFILLFDLYTSRYFIIAITLIFSLLLVSPLPLFALKFKNFGWADNKIRYIFLAICAVLLIVFQLIAIPFIVILYILASIVNNIFKLTV